MHSLSGALYSLSGLCKVCRGFAKSFGASPWAPRWAPLPFTPPAPPLRGPSAGAPPPRGPSALRTYITCLLYIHINAAICIHRYITKHLKTRPLQPPGCNNSKVRLYFHDPVAQIIVNIYITLMPSPNRCRTEFTPKILDRSTPNSVARLFDTPGIMETSIQS